MSEGTEARDEALERVEYNAHREWLSCAYAAGKHIASYAEPFTADDIRHMMEVHYPGVTTHEPRAMGAIMNKLKRAGVITPTDRFIPSTRKERHNGPIRVWQPTRSEL